MIRRLSLQKLSMFCEVQSFNVHVSEREKEIRIKCARLESVCNSERGEKRIAIMLIFCSFGMTEEVGVV